MKKKIVEGKYSIAYGKFVKRIHNIFKVLSIICGHEYNITTFRIIESQLAEKLTKFNQYNIVVDPTIKYIVTSSLVGHAMVEHHARKTGESVYSFGKLFRYAVNMVFSFKLWQISLSFNQKPSYLVKEVIVGESH